MSFMIFPEGRTIMNGLNFDTYFFLHNMKWKVDYYVYMWRNITVNIMLVLTTELVTFTVIVLHMYTYFTTRSKAHFFSLYRQIYILGDLLLAR